VTSRHLIQLVGADRRRPDRIVDRARSARARRRADDRYDRALATGAPARGRAGIADQVVETNAAAVEGADLVIVLPVGACGAVAKSGPSRTRRDRVDVGSVKGSVVRDMAASAKTVHFIPAPRSPALNIPARMRAELSSTAGAS
jgi:prephenate dehydrogenase